jgi:hypothetical protein
MVYKEMRIFLIFNKNNESQDGRSGFRANKVNILEGKM